MDVQVASAELSPKREFLSPPSIHFCFTSHFSQLLFGISTALPFLGARIAYAVIAAFSSLDLYGTDLSSDPNLRKLNPINGEWYLYLVLGPVMEYVTVLLYILASVVLAQRYHY